ncbi:CU044_5270 family protein [Hamadaea sp. NPDC050747]|uniref:CU044_5270 family protein n=1 Tax=Hamadaea sp. NPDC050747 TaxID=3155789 RepID=UPI0033EA35AB
MNANPHHRTARDDATELARLMPAPTVPGLDADRHRKLREHLMHELQDPSAANAGSPRRSRRRLLWGLAPATAVAAAVITVLALSGAPDTARPEAAGGDAAAPLLEQFALVAEQQPAAKVRDDQYVYVKSLVSFAGISQEDPQQPAKVTLDEPHERQTWFSVDGSRAGRLAEGRKPAVLEPNLQPSLHLPTYRYLESLPTDPGQLLTMLYAGNDDTKNSREQKAFETIGDLLRESIASPKVTAALYRAAAKIPGVIVVQDAVDAAGRHGVAVARVDEHTGTRHEWIFDKKTSTFYGEREVQANRSPEGIEPGTVLGRSAVLERAIVDDTTQTN